MALAMEEEMAGKLKHTAWVIHRELTRAVLLCGLIAFLFWASRWLPQESGEWDLGPTLSTAGIVLAFIVVTHLIRRVLMPRLDLQNLGIAASQSPLGAAIVFASIIYMVTVFYSGFVAVIR